ncbi:MAG: histidine--tRNA ligase [Candidatus Cloacimonetes bacterium]|nr:histidine--tRNA ligase [Candidatus Cloacimonadota bacterium]
MNKKYSIPRGTFDILPKDSFKWQFISDKFKQMMLYYNYKEIITPIFENSEIFERTSGENSDVVKKEMYRFTDRKEREFALRPEGTAPVVRSFIENNLQANGINKLYYIGPMFRYDRPQKGRSRQFYQYGLELLGSDSFYYDAEIIALGYNFLKSLGLKNFTVEINSIGSKEINSSYDQELRSFLSSNFQLLCHDCQARYDKNPKRILDCKNETCRKITASAPSVLDFLNEADKSHFESVKTHLDYLNIPYTVNDRIVRGLDYYNSTAFEFKYHGLGAQDTILAGGRYNGLVSDLGGADIPGIGFAGGISRLLLALEEEDIEIPDNSQIDTLIGAIGTFAVKQAVILTNELRLSGYKVEFFYEKNNIKWIMKNADKMNCKSVILIGDNEIQSGEATLKILSTGKQQNVKFTDISKVLNNYLTI